jgi:deoxyribonuclease V
MKFQNLHPWNVSPKEAIAIQNHLRPRIIKEDKFTNLRSLASIDVGYKFGTDKAQAVVVVMQFPSLEIIETTNTRAPLTFPYIPGLLSFREIPLILDAIKLLSHRPQLLICDAHGIAHPRRFGLASHLGLICDLPSIGVGKSCLVGQYKEVPLQRGSWQALTSESEVIGAVLRTQNGINPVIISIGHRISLITAIHITLLCIHKFRLPEPIRTAHHLAKTITTPNI